MLKSYTFKLIKNLTTVNAIHHFGVSLCKNPNLAEQVSCGLKKKKQQHKSVSPVVGLTIGISVLLLIVASICFVLIRKRRHGKI